jgi:squalene-hopene/tetraprenyl-beta-curcumene cyclase
MRRIPIQKKGNINMKMHPGRDGRNLGGGGFVMTMFLRLQAAVIMICVLGFSINAAESTAQPVDGNRSDQSFRLEVLNAINKATNWLATVQNEDGSWSQAEYPALTGLVLTAFVGEPSGKTKQRHKEVIDRGFQYVLSNVQPDGGIYSAAAPAPLENYNTAVCLTALIFANRSDFEPQILRARNYLVSLQNEGGLGYNKSGSSDMSNTVLALEALHYSRNIVQRDLPPGMEAARELDWDAAIKFIESCQNLPEVNKHEWVSTAPEDRGGFVYSTSESKAGERESEDGAVALRSYGSMSYAGLLSYIYADLDKEDPRVEAVVDWLRAHYTLDENPGMGEQGLFYYYHTMAKGLNAYGAERLTLKDGKTVDWRRDLAMRLLSLQDGTNGSWVNDNGRWWEKDPVLVTSYATIALEILYRGL